MKLKYISTPLLIVGIFIFGYFILQNQGIQISSKYMGFVLIGLIYSVFLTIISNIKKSNIKQKLIIASIPVISGIVFLEFYDLKYYNVREYHMKLYDPPKKKFYHIYSQDTVENWKNDEFVHYRKTNSEGLSDIEHTIKTDSCTYTIIGLGDSFTEGWGTTSDSTWLKFLAKDLRNDSLFKFQFINAGVGGSDPVYEYVLLKDKLLKYKPDMVILALGYELQEMLVRGGMERFQSDGSISYRKKPFWFPLYKLSGVFRIITHTYADHTLIPKIDYSQAKKKAIQDIQNCLLLFKLLSEKYHFQLILVVYPENVEVIDKNFSFWDKPILFAKSNNIITVDLLKFYTDSIKMDESNIMNYYWQKDGHHNAKGYKMFAKGIKNSVLKQIKFREAN